MEEKMSKEIQNSLCHGAARDDDDQRIAPFDRLKNLLKDGDDVEITEEIEGKLDFLLGNKDKPTANKVKWWKNITKSIQKLITYIQLKLFPNPNYNKDYKRK